MLVKRIRVEHLDCADCASSLRRELLKENNIESIDLSPETGEVIGTTIREQTEQVMKNIQGLLESQIASFTDVLKTTCFLADMSDFAAFNEVYAKYFTGKPARSCVAVKDLPKGVLCEVETIAVIEEN